MVVHAAESMGACWARHRILTELRQDEEFVLQIDSHSRFVEGWDEILLGMISKCASDKPILTTYPVGYRPPDRLGEECITGLIAYRFNEHGILLFHTRSLPVAAAPATPMPSAFLSGNCLFAPSSAFDEVPYDPSLYFHGEEISLAVRLWTHGWDLFAPNYLFMYHDYSTNRGRPRNWDDNRDWTSLNRRSFARVRHLLGIELSSDPEVVADLDRYGLGQVRSLSEYEAFADVRFARRHIGPRACDGRFPLPEQAVGRRRRFKFREIFLNNGWGNKETRSGPGSTWLATKAMQESLQTQLGQLRIASLVDAGCGDCNWISLISEGLDLYVGCDIVPELLDYNSALHGRGARARLFAAVDIVETILPTADAVLCRHVMTHLPNADIRRCLHNFKRSGTRYLIATNYLAATNGEIETARWRPINLCAPPFDLPEPQSFIGDGKGCALAIWDMWSFGED